MTELHLLLAEVVGKSLLLLTLAVLVTAALGRASAHIRHRVWGMTMLGLLILPVGSLLLPSWSAPLPLPESWRWEATPTARPLTSHQSHLLTPAGSPPGLGVVTEPVGDRTAPALSSATASTGVPGSDIGTTDAGGWRGSPALPIGVIALWLLGSGLVGCWFGWGHWRIHRIGRRARPASPRWRGRLDEVAHRLGISRRVDIRVDPEAGSPVTWGERRPIVLLPEVADQWPENRQALTLEHELLHVKRRDWLWEVVSQAACAMYWPNPLVWVAARRHAVEREHACDEAVLAAGATPSLYATHLLTVARHLRRRPIMTASVGMAEHSKLEDRLVWIHKMSRRQPPTPRLGMVSVFALAVVTILAGVEPWTAPDGPRAAGPDSRSGTVARIQVAGDDTVSVVVVDPTGAVTGRAAVALTEGAGVRTITFGDDGDTVLVLGPNGATGDVHILDPDGGVTTLPADSLTGNVFAIGSEGEIRAIDAGEDDVVIFDPDTNDFVVAGDEHTVVTGEDVLLCLRDDLVYAQDARIRRLGEGPLILDHEDAIDIRELDLDEVLHVDPTGQLTRGNDDLRVGDGLVVRTRDGRTLRLESSPVLVTTDGDIVHTRVSGRVIIDPTHPDGVIPDPGSSVVFETDRGGRRLEVSATAGDDIELEWSVDGASREVDGEARDLLRAIVDLCGDD